MDKFSKTLTYDFTSAMGLGFGKKTAAHPKNQGAPPKTLEKVPFSSHSGRFSAFLVGHPGFRDELPFFYHPLDPSQNYNRIVGIFDFRPSGRDLFTFLRASVAQRVQN